MNNFDSSTLGVEDKQILIEFFDRRKIFDEYLKANSVKLFTCPGCGYPTREGQSTYEICSICKWEDDGQDDPKADEIRGGPNKSLSLTESRLNIGRVLKQLARDLNGTINLSPEEVLKTLSQREAQIESFRKAKFTDQTHIDDPFWSEHSKLQTDTLSQLIKKI